MKVLLVVGSPRKKGNTDILMDKVIEGLEKYNIETEKIYLKDYNFDGCIGCEGCAKSLKCVIKDDMQEIYKKMEEADGLVLGSPTYFYNVTWLTKKYIDRLYAYDAFSDDDRSVWLSPNEIFGIKFAVTVAVCEQESIEDLGYTSVVMNKTLEAVGYRVVSSVCALHVFEKGAINKFDSELDKALKAGEKLGKSLLLYKEVKENNKAIEKA